MPNDWSAYLTGEDPLTGINPLEYILSPSSALGIDLPTWANPLGALFGGKKDDKPDWTVKNGQVVYKNSNINPVPLTDVPGANIVPSKAYRQTAENIKMLEDFFPLYSKAIAGQIIPQEQAKLEAAKVTSPQFADLMTQLYKQYGPQLNQIGNDIALQNALASAERDKTVLQGPGKDLVSEAINAMRIADPEFFATRELESSRIADLLKSIDLSGGLSDTERREIEQGLSREGSQRGTLNAPSQSDTVANAMRYGEAGRNRVLQNQSALSNAIQASTQFLPASRTGIDAFQVATGKSSVPNSGENKFTGISMPGQEAYGLANSLFGNIGQNSSQQADINATKKLNEKDWLDQFSQFTGALGNLGSFAGGAFAMCWVAREVYGVKNPRWIIFRQWLMNKAPRWLHNLYCRHGQRFAWFIHDKPKLKNVIRVLMNNIISKHYEN